MQEKDVRRELQKSCTAQDRELVHVSELVGLALQAKQCAKAQKERKRA